MTDIALIPLNVDQWEQTRGRAKQTVRSRLVQPKRSQFLRADSKYPPVMAAGGIAVMVIVALAAFVISAGRQIAAMDVITEKIANDYSARISANYVTGVLMAVLALSELGVIAFGFCARVLASTQTIERIFRAFQLISVAIALGGNITVSALSYVPQAIAFDALVTLAAPTIVIGVGLAIEQIANEAITHRQSALRAYNEKRAEYDRLYAAPENHPDWYPVWGEIILDQLRRIAENRAVIDAAIESDPRSRQSIVLREYQRHEWQFSPTPVKPVNPVIDKPLRSDKQQRIWDFFVKNPNRVNEVSRDLALEIGDVSHELVNNVRNEFVEFSKNGHAAPNEPSEVSN